MKKTMKIFIFLLAFILIFTNFVYAKLSSSTHFEVVDKSVCEIEFGENGKFKKQIISYDENSVTLQLDVNNTAEEKIEKTVSEIFLVIDNSLSLNEKVSDTETRKDLIYNSAKQLATKLNASDPEFKIGVICFSSNSDVTKEGTIEDATLMQTLTTENSDILKAIENINDTDFGSRTNIEAGLELANQNFSGTADKEYIILISDGVPNDDIHGNTLQFSDIVVGNTKNKLIELNDKGIKLISVLAGVSDTVESTVGKTYVELAEEVFGTEDKPTAGKYYFISDSNIKTIVENNVFNDVEISKSNTLTNIVIKDYFPKKIIDNFDFSYVTSPNLGKVSAEIDKTTNSITWTIPSLDAGESASLQYKLTLKDNFNKDILGQILPTNEKVNITDDQGDNETSTVSPKGKVTEDIPIEVIPQAGTSHMLFTGFVILSILSAFGIYKYIKYKNSIT